MCWSVARAVMLSVIVSTLGTTAFATQSEGYRAGKYDAGLKDLFLSHDCVLTTNQMVDLVVSNGGKDYLTNAVANVWLASGWMRMGDLNDYGAPMNYRMIGTSDCPS